jgi:hypothetical protein
MKLSPRRPAEVVSDEIRFLQEWNIFPKSLLVNPTNDLAYCTLFALDSDEGD